MSRTRGEGRSGSEKQQKVMTPYHIRKAEIEAEKAEEASWAAKCGPVTVRKKDDGDSSR